MAFWSTFLGFDPNHQKAFPGQQSGEEVEMMTVFHWMSLMPFLLQFFLAISALIIFFYATGILSSLSTQNKLYLFTMLIAIFLHLICFRLYNYFLKVLIITNMRIIDIRHTVFLNRERDVLPMNYIHDFRYICKGIFPRLFHYGTLEILGASSEIKYTLMYIPHVNKIHHLLGEIHQKNFRPPSDY